MKNHKGGAGLTVEDILVSLVPRLASDKTIPPWPPDVFALCAGVLDRTDGFRWVVMDWPPRSAAGWERDLDRIRTSWRASAAVGAPPPPAVRRWWKSIWSRAGKHLDVAGDDKQLCLALLSLLVSSDHTAAGAWMPREQGDVPDGLEIRAHALLAAAETGYGMTLGIEVEPSQLLVLPKIHTPQVGLTLRSLSHNLAICRPGPVAPSWYILEEEFWSVRGPEKLESLNILLLPWPEVVLPSEFKPTRGNLRNMDPARFGFFTYSPKNGGVVDITRVRRAVSEAERTCGRIDMVVLPELAAQPGTCVRLSADLGRIVIGGEGVPPRQTAPGVNQAAVAVPVLGQRTTKGLRQPEVLATIHWRKEKFHRWKLDEAQIGRYGLGKSLSPTKEWWEDISLERRRLPFWAVNSWLSFCVLICEDLARQEPIGELIRSVGPGLVIALLMDGPQKEARWPGRYATVLADDPGSSVLTLTSLGMALLSRPPHMEPSRVIGLWKEAGGDAREIEMPPGASGVVLCLTGRPAPEDSADGRRIGTAGQARLHGVHPVFLPGVAQRGRR